MSVATRSGVWPKGHTEWHGLLQSKCWVHVGGLVGFGRWALEFFGTMTMKSQENFLNATYSFTYRVVTDKQLQIVEVAAFAAN